MRDALDVGMPEPEGFRLTGRHVLAMFVAFFGVIFLVNGYFLARALSTHTGVVSVEPYRKGLAYNGRIRADEVQAALGWKDAVAIEAVGLLTVTLEGPSSAPISGLHLSVLVGRPSTAQSDRTLMLTETAPGRYVAETSALAPGHWIVTLEARHGAGNTEPVYRAKRRLWLKQ